MERPLMLLSGNANRPLAAKISEYLGTPLADMEVFKFANDNTFVKINENIRKRDLFIVQPTCRPTNDNIMELLIIMDACKRASANSITAVVPYFDYARTDKKDQPRVPISAKLVADLIALAGATRIVTIDLHAEQIQGFFNIPVDHLYAAPILKDYLAQRALGEFVVVAPDVGSAGRARGIAKRIPTALAFIDKRRIGNVDFAEVLKVVGDVEGKDCLIVDDIVDTGGTLVKAAEALEKEGAREVYAAATHPVLSGNAVGRLEESLLKEVIVTDTVPIPPEKVRASTKLRILSVAPLLGEAIRRIHHGESVSSLFI